MTNTIEFKSLKEVTQAVASVGLSITPEVLAALQRNCKEPFLQHLSCCVAKEDPEGKHKKYLETIVKCLDSQTLSHLQDIVPDATVDDVAVAAKNGPVRLMSVLSIALEPSNERYGEAIAWLKDIAGCSKAPSQTVQPKPQVAPAPSPPPPSAARASEPPVAPHTGADPSTQTFQSHHVYGSNFALCFNATNWKGEYGVMVDAATANGPKSYDWKNAIHVWLDPVEVAAVVAVFRRWRKSVEFSAHGNQNDKSFAIEYQSPHFFAKVSAKVDAGKTRAVRIQPTDATAVSILFLRQLGEAYKGIPLTEILATVRATHQMENAA